MADDARLKVLHWELIEEACENKGVRQEEWVKAVAIGSEGFIMEMKEKMGFGALGRKIVSTESDCMLREPESAYDAYFEAEKVDLSTENTGYFDKNL